MRGAIMVKRKKSQYQYNTSKQRNKRSRIVKAVLPWFFVAVVGTVSFFFLFNELLKLFPSLTGLAEFIHKI